MTGTGFDTEGADTTLMSLSGVGFAGPRRQLPAQHGIEACMDFATACLPTQQAAAAGIAVTKSTSPMAITPANCFVHVQAGFTMSATLNEVLQFHTHGTVALHTAFV